MRFARNCPFPTIERSPLITLSQLKLAAQATDFDEERYGYEDASGQVHL